MDYLRKEKIKFLLMSEYRKTWDCLKTQKQKCCELKDLVGLVDYLLDQLVDDIGDNNGEFYNYISSKIKIFKQYMFDHTINCKICVKSQ